MRRILALAAALALLLCACHLPEIPPAPNPYRAYDLTDLANFLNASQRGAFESALRAELATRGIPPGSVSLLFDSADPGSVKIPFTSSGDNLDDLNTDVLAKYVAAQIADGLGGTATTAPGAATTTAAGATSAGKATTTAPGASTTGRGATTMSTTTTTAQFIPPSHTPPSQYVIGGNLSRDRIATTIVEKTTDDSRKVLQIQGANGNFLVERRPYGGNYAGEGLTLYVYYDATGSGTYNRIDAGNVRVTPGGAEGTCNVFLVLDPSAEIIDVTNPSGKGIWADADFYLGNPSTTIRDNYVATIRRGLLRLDQSGSPIYQFNGQAMVKLK